jgi:hypothetical protein
MQLATLSNAAAVVASNALATGASLSFTKGKKVTEGTFARAIVFASKGDRIAMGQSMYANWLQNGQYRPIVNDILSSGMVPKAALPYVRVFSGVTEAGPVGKDQLIKLCQAVKAEVDAKVAAGKPIPKGEKGFVYEIVARIATAAQPETIEAE